jgi:hypothetical protein
VSFNASKLLHLDFEEMQCEPNCVDSNVKQEIRIQIFLQIIHLDETNGKYVWCVHEIELLLRNVFSVSHMPRPFEKIGWAII